MKWNWISLGEKMFFFSSGDRDMKTPLLRRLDSELGE